MSKKLTHEYVRDYIKERGYKLLSKYKSSKNKMILCCPKGHIYRVVWNSFKQGYRCPECAGLKRLTHEYVKAEFKKEGYILLSDCYINNYTKLQYICPNNHKESIHWKNFKQGKRCGQCFKKNNIGKNAVNWKGGNQVAWFDTYKSQISLTDDNRRDPNNNNILQVRCTESGCRKWFTPTQSQVCNRINALNSNNGKESNFYCSEECKENCSTFGQRIHLKGYKSDTYRDPDWALMVKERDEYECQICGSKEQLKAHHFEGIEQNPIESFDLDMGITLCKKCHDAAHAEIGCRYIDLTHKALCKVVEKKENNLK